MELRSLSPPGSPAGCQVTSQNKGPPATILSNLFGTELTTPVNWVCMLYFAYLEIKLTAAAAVRGGKNSKEKNVSSFFIFRKIFCTSVSGDLVGDVEREDVWEDVIEEDDDVLLLRWWSMEAGKAGCDWTFGIRSRCWAITGEGDWDLDKWVLRGGSIILLNTAQVLHVSVGFSMHRDVN